MMLSKIKMFLLSLCLIGSLGLATAVPVYAATFQGDACSGLGQLDGTSTSCSPGSGDNSITNLAEAAVNILSIIIGIVAVIMIIIAGFKYVVSGGDSGSVSSAKSTLIYALVGLAVAALAQVIVHYVLNNIAK